MRHSKINSASKISVIIFLIAGIAGASLTERLEGRFLKSRIKLRIDEGWKVQSGNIPGAQATGFNDSSWTTTNVPHDMSITLYSATNLDPGAIGWYRRHFTLPAGFAGKKVIVQFDGVYHDSKIYLNGTQVGNQQYGYVSFYCDLTPYLNATGDNVLAVFVDNETVRNSRWYSGTGIFRHVWLIATDFVYVRNWGTAVTTPAVAAAQSQIRVQTDIVNDLTTAQTRTVQTTIYDSIGNALQTVDTTITVKPKTIDTVMSIDTCVQTLVLSSCNLWSPSTPYLYYAYTRIINNATPADDYVTQFGIRQLQYVANQGLLINGVATKMKGICMHHMAVPTGAAVPERMSERTIKELLASGCTSIRTSHNPVSPEFYDLCDQLGMLVLDEWCDKWYDTSGGAFYENWAQTWPKDLASFIERDRNHPSIVMWSVGNEVASGATVPPYLTTNLQILVPYVKNIDKTRAVTNACVAGSSDPAGLGALANIEDIVGLNYKEAQYGAIHSSNPNALILGTEQAPYLNGAVPTWFAVRNTPYVIGHHIWVGVDFLAEGISSGGPPSGYLDYCIFRKAWFYYQQSQWSDSPVVHIGIGNAVDPAPSTWATPFLSESWNQSGSVNVVTYTNCDSVILYVNATKIGTEYLNNFSNMIMQWPNVQYQSGVIKAIGMKSGIQAAVDSIMTVGKPAKVFLKPDRTTLYADGEDICCLEVDIDDANDNLVFNDSTDTVQFTLSGQGRSLGIGSADYTNFEPFKAMSRKAYNGRVFIPIQSDTVPGTITVGVSSPGLTSGSLILTTVPQVITTAIRSAPLRNTQGSRADLFTCVCNPDSKNIQVRYRVDVPSAISLSVIAPSGRMVNCLANNKYQAAGAYSTEWNAMNRIGVYLFVLKINNTKMVRKICIVR
jgi:beta-galactosidase